MGRSKPRAVRIVPAAERMSLVDGSPLPAPGWYATPPGPVAPVRARYACPRCAAAHEVDLQAIGHLAWMRELPTETDYPEFDEIEVGHDLECRCGQVSRLVGGFGEWGKMGPYFFSIDRILELE